MSQHIPSFLLTGNNDIGYSEKKGKMKLTFIDRTIRRTVSFIRESIVQYETSINKTGFQHLSAPGILIFYLCYIVCIGLTHSLTGHFIYAAIFFFLIITSTVRLSAVYVKALMLGFLFGFLVMVPACLNVFVPGKIAVSLIKFSEEKHFLIYRIPEVVGITYEGIIVVSRMFMKVFNSLTLTFLILYSISFDRLIKSLKLIKVPGLFILIVALSYKFIYTMALTVEEMFLALKSRWMGNFDQKKTRNIIAGRMGYIFKKSYLRYEEVYKAMVSRGFTGEINIKSKERISLKEAFILFIAVGTGVIISLINY